MKHAVFSFLLIAVSLFSSKTPAQTVRVLQESPIRREAQSKDFAFWEAQTDSTTLAFVATLEAAGVGPDANLESLYGKLKQKALALGANVFRLRSFEALPQKKTLTLDLYFGSDSLLDVNAANHAKNVVYLFGALSKGNGSCTFKLNDEKKGLQDGTFYRIPVKDGQEVKISKGGITGASLRVTGKGNKPELYLSLTGLGVGAGPMIGGIGAMTMPTVAFNTGRIEAMDRNFGRLLVALLSEGER